MKRVAIAALLLALLGMTACGDDQPAQPAAEVPEWAKVAREQIAEAKRHGVPVAFENDLGMRFVLIPAGTFLMGSQPQDELAAPDEVQHQVTLTRSFYLQVMEVTNGTFRQFRPDHDAGGRDVPPDPDRVLVLNRDHQPAMNVSWHDASDFATWLTEQYPPRDYRLPTEGEWEHACRAGTTTVFAFGDALEDHQASFRRDTKPLSERLEEPRRVGSYIPNAWGLYDMHGNASEWCADWLEEWAEDDELAHDEFGFKPYSPAAATDPTGPDKGRQKIVRGGSYGTGVEYLASGARGAVKPSWKQKGWHSIGFRLVSPLPEPKGGE